MNDFAKLWAGYTVSRVGAQITLLALPLTAVLLLGAGPAETGLLVAARTLPLALAGLAIGVWIDRHRRLPLMVWASIASAVVVASIPLSAALGVLGMAQLYAVSLVVGALATTVELARTAVLPQVVGRARLVSANSRLQASDAVAQVSGPSIGGVLVQALTAPVAMAVDAATFAVSALSIALIRVEETTHPRARDEGLRHEVTEGLRWMYGHEVLFRSTVAIALANVEWFAVQAVLVVYATRDLGLSPALLGAALAVVGPFSLIGAAVTAPLVRRWGLGPVMILSLALEASSRLVLPFAGGSEIQAALVLGATQALVGLTVPLWTITSRTLQQAVTPDRLIGRVASAAFFVGFIVAPPSAIAAGLIADVIGMRPMLFATGVIAVVAMLYLFFSPVRRFREVADTHHA